MHDRRCPLMTGRPAVTAARGVVRTALYTRSGVRHVKSIDRRLMSDYSVVEHQSSDFGRLVREEVTHVDSVTLEALTAVVLVCLGLLLGTAWTTQALQPRLRRQAEERRQLNEEWAALRIAHEQQNRCPHCGIPWAECYWYIAPTIVDDPLDDD